MMHRGKPFAISLRIVAIVLALFMVSESAAARVTEHRSRAVTRQFERLHPCPSTGRTIGACPGWIKDHVIPLCAGGPDSVSNMQWQTVADAKAKDRDEFRECRKIRRKVRPVK